MRFIDSHAHLADPAFDVDRDDVIARARDAGAARHRVASASPSPPPIELRRIAAAHPGFVYHTAGIHPHDAANFDARPRHRRDSPPRSAGRSRRRRVRARLPLRSFAARRAAARVRRRSCAGERSSTAPSSCTRARRTPTLAAMIAELRRAPAFAASCTVSPARAPLAEAALVGRLVCLVQWHCDVQEVGRSWPAAPRAR